MKILYKFEKNKTEVVKQEKKTKGPDGKEVVTIEEIKKDVPVKFCIIKSNRNLSDSAEVYYNITYSKAMKEGQMSRASLIRLISNDKGIFSDDELKHLDELKVSLLNKQEEFTLLRLKKEDERKETDKKRMDELNKELFDITKELQKYESAQESLFNRTAENYAFAKYIVWYILNISAKVGEKDEIIPLFPGKTYEDKLNQYDEIIESDDEFMKEVVREFTFLVTAWINGVASTEEEFKRVLNLVRDGQP